MLTSTNDQRDAVIVLRYDMLWTPSLLGRVHLDAPGQRHGQQPVSGTPGPKVVKQDKSSRGSVDTTRTRSGPQRVRMSSGGRPMGAAKGKRTNTMASCSPPPLGRVLTRRHSSRDASTFRSTTTALPQRNGADPTRRRLLGGGGGGRRRRQAPTPAQPASGGGCLPQPRWAVCATGVGAHQGQTNREGERDIWWTAWTARGGTGHLGRTETQRGRLWMA